MMPPREGLARRTANDLLKEMQVVDYPVRPDEIVRRKGLLFEERDDFPAGVYGALFRSGDQFGIIISSKCPGDGHRRFTIAHELGHYHVPGHLDCLFESGADLVPSMGGHFRSRRDPTEVEADYFANELLMPERFARPLVNGLDSGLSGIKELARRFDTSLSAAAVRFASLVREPTVVVLSLNGVVEWAATAPALWSHRWARRSWKGDWAPRGSATKQLGDAMDRVIRGDFAESSLLLCEWLESAPGEIEVREQAMGLGVYGRVLSVITALGLPDPEELEDQERTHEEDSDWRSALRGYRLG